MNAPAIFRITCCAALLAGAALAPALAAKVSTAQDSLYKKERAACLDGSTQQDRATCLKEAKAARAEARRDGLHNVGATVQADNALLRCKAQPEGTDRSLCERMVRGEGTQTGTVGAGGVLKELTIRQTEPAASAPTKP